MCLYRSKNDKVFPERGHVIAMIKFRKLHRQFQTLNFLSLIKERLSFPPQIAKEQLKNC